VGWWLDSCNRSFGFSDLVHVCGEYGVVEERGGN
jgi:hypothetical protein